MARPIPKSATKPNKLRVFGLGQTTRYGQFTVARVRAPDDVVAAKLFVDWFKRRGLPQAALDRIRQGKPSCVQNGKVLGVVIGTIELTLFELAGNPSAAYYRHIPQEVQPLRSLDLKPFVYPGATKPTGQPSRPKPKSKR